MRATIVLVLDAGPERALRSVAALANVPDEPPYDVVIVDDASVGLAELLARLEGDVDIVRTESRLGPAGAFAQGAARAQGDVLVMLRDAPEVDPGFLAPLVAALEDPDVAVATSGAGGAPVAAQAVAVRRTDLEAIGGTPKAPDGMEGAAMVAALASRGRVEEVPGSVVHPPHARTVGLRHPPGDAPELTVVIPTLDATSDRVRRCVAAVQNTTPEPHEIVIVDNGAPPQGFTAPVNAGIRAARTPYVVVMNDDVQVLDGWWLPLRAALDAGAAVAFPLTIEGAMRVDFAAWCFAVSRDAIGRYGVAEGEFFDPQLRVWYQDTDLLQRLREAGNPPRLVQESRIRHGLSETVASDDPALRAWLQQEIAQDQQRFEAKHGTGVAGAAREG
jgi:GT2 family glycosyltransferase